MNYFKVKLADGTVLWFWTPEGGITSSLAVMRILNEGQLAGRMGLATIYSATSQDPVAAGLATPDQVFPLAGTDPIGLDPGTDAILDPAAANAIIDPVTTSPIDPGRITAEPITTDPAQAAVPPPDPAQAPALVPESGGGGARTFQLSMAGLAAGAVALYIFLSRKQKR